MGNPEIRLAAAWQLVKDGRSREAEPVLRELLLLLPNHPFPRVILGSILMEQGRTEEAAPIALEALEFGPRLADAWNLHGLVRRHLDDAEGAFEAFEEAHRLAPDHAWAALNLADQWLLRRDPTQALALLDIAASELGDLEEVHLDRAVALEELGRSEEAELILRRLLQATPDSPRAQLNLANLLLCAGRNLEEAWRLRESRWEALGVARRRMGIPPWDGAPFPGKTLLLHGLQEGLGDAVMFVRFAALAKQRGGRVILECHPSLATLLATCPGIDSVVLQGESVPPADFHGVLMSLPSVLGDDPGGIPRSIPYLALPSLIPNRELLSGRLDAIGDRRAIGLVWAGRSGHLDDAYRSLPPEAFTSFAACQDVVFVGLQKRDSGEPAPELPPGVAFLDLGDLLSDFADTAYALSRIEGLISVDTSVAHVAGAMGLPVKLLLAHRAEWRWMREREDSPWYPTFRLYRQPRSGDWDSVLERAARDLQSDRGTC